MRRLTPLGSVLLLTACAASPTTRMLPREDGTISAISLARDESVAELAGIDEANSYCKQKGATAVFLDEKTEYQGVLTEKGRGVARVVKNIPGIGDKVTSDEDYRVTTRFKCVSTE